MPPKSRAGLSTAVRYDGSFDVSMPPGFVPEALPFGTLARIHALDEKLASDDVF